MQVHKAVDSKRDLRIGLAHQRAGRLSQAETIYRRILQDQPKNTDALHLLATLALQSGKPEAAVSLLQQAIRYNKRNAAYHLNLGLAYKAQGRLVSALDSIDTALQVQPGFAEAHYHRGAILALQRRHAEAARALRQAIAARRDYPQAHARLGNALAAQGRFDKAVEAFQRALSLQPDDHQTHVDLGNALVALDRREQASASYQRALALQPGNRAALDNLVDNRIKLCDWREIHRLHSDYLQPALREADTTDAPTRPMLVARLPIEVGEAEQLRLARAMVRVRTRSREPLRDRLNFRHAPHDGRLRIGYLCGDFRNHATAHLIQDLFGLHERTDFEVIAYSTGPDDGSHYRRRIRETSDGFHDLREADPVTLARQIHDDKIDILIDLHGHSGDNRLEALALKPAPLQVAYLGYPGTTGADFIDYIVTDRIVTPPDTQRHYDEQFAYLPHSYQINSARPKTDRRPTRADCKLPPDGFVFCCFNGLYKIDPTLFDLWMRLLHQIPGSVLWLLDGPADTLRNLRREAKARDIDPARLIFAPRRVPAEHLARLPLAELFLDTRFVNAHTTGSDALWAGVPVLTCPGERFAGRVGKSLVSAAGVPELAVDSLAEYESTALRLARHPDELRSLRERLAAGRDTCPLFDTRRFVRDLEQAYRQMWALYRAGEAPRQIDVRET